MVIPEVRVPLLRSAAALVAAVGCALSSLRSARSVDQPEQAVRWASCHSQTGHKVMPLYDSGYSVGLRHRTQSA